MHISKKYPQNCYWAMFGDVTSWGAKVLESCNEAGLLLAGVHGTYIGSFLLTTLSNPAAADSDRGTGRMPFVTMSWRRLWLIASCL
jgi:hypothetical protein